MSATEAAPAAAAPAAATVAAPSGGIDAEKVVAQIAALTAQMEALRSENSRLISTIATIGVPRRDHGLDASGSAFGGDHDGAAGASGGVGGGAAAGGPRKSYGEMKVWVGSWNMGASDPFLGMNIPKERGAVSKLLAPFIPQGYDLYVLGVQEGISDKVYEAVEAHTGTFRLPLNAKLYPAREHKRELGKGVRSRRLGRAIPVQSFLDDARDGILPDSVASTGDMLDRVWGRGDGALLTPKFTGMGVFVAPVVAPYCRLLGVYKHSFGASEGSKGGVGVALGLYDVTVAFVTCHLASKRPDMRRAQYSELVDRLGAKLGGRGFGLNESFHHIIWTGDLNYHVKGVTAREAVAAIAKGEHMQLLLDHDELLDDKERELSFYEYEEPLMGPRFYPTYKKLVARGKINYRTPSWPDAVYVTKFTEPLYKGGREADRVPSWTDRIQYHSLSDRSGELLPEPLDPDHPETSLHNYHAVNDGLDISDHSPVYATFSLAISVDEEGADEGLAAAVEGLQAQLGYRRRGVDDGSSDAGSVYGAGGAAAAAGGGVAPAASLSSSYRLGGTGAAPLLSDAEFASLHPSQRPLEVILSLRNVLVQYKGAMQAPRALNVLFPLPYEDSNEIPDRTKVIRAGLGLLGALTAGSSGANGVVDSRGSLSAVVPPCLVSRASKLEALHLLVKVSMDDGTKAQCVVCMRDGGFVGAGSHVNTFLVPLTINGLPLKDAAGRPAQVQFELKMEAYERGGTMHHGGGWGRATAAAVAAPPTAASTPGGHHGSVGPASSVRSGAGGGGGGYGGAGTGGGSVLGSPGFAPPTSAGGMHAGASYGAPAAGYATASGPLRTGPLPFSPAGPAGGAPAAAGGGGGGGGRGGPHHASSPYSYTHAPAHVLGGASASASGGGYGGYIPEEEGEEGEGEEGGYTPVAVSRGASGALPGGGGGVAGGRPRPAVVSALSYSPLAPARGGAGASGAAGVGAAAPGAAPDAAAMLASAVRPRPTAASRIAAAGTSVRNLSTPGVPPAAGAAGAATAAAGGVGIAAAAGGGVASLPGVAVVAGGAPAGGAVGPEADARAAAIRAARQRALARAQATAAATASIVGGGGTPVGGSTRLLPHPGATA